MVFLCRGGLATDDKPEINVLAPKTSLISGGVDLPALIEEFETHVIRQALKAAKGVKNQAAQLLNIKRTTLVEKMKKKGMLK
ncbi:MAG: helix-turn-helix domain-containing protein [Candidatus Sumerlaeota bacterium]|nr:helix-turn-helix domain-containing protein [Candidatus Sumerlaeota bacterium]